MITLVLGGARSGKSEVAEEHVRTLAGAGSVLYIATAIPDPADEDFAARIEAHRRRRPDSWTTVEVGTDLAHAIANVDAGATVLVDSLGPWVAAQPEMKVDVGRLIDALRARSGATVLVSDEVGLGVHPSSEAGRLFRDRVGDVNREIATVADSVLLVVAGRVLPLDRLPP